MILISFTIILIIILPISEENHNYIHKMSDRMDKEQIKRMIAEKIQTLHGIEAQVPASFRELRGKWNQTAEPYMELNYNQEM